MKSRALASFQRAIGRSGFAVASRKATVASGIRAWAMNWSPSASASSPGKWVAKERRTMKPGRSTAARGETRSGASRDAITSPAPSSRSAVTRYLPAPRSASGNSSMAGRIRASRRHGPLHERGARSGLLLAEAGIRKDAKACPVFVARIHGLGGNAQQVAGSEDAPDGRLQHGRPELKGPEAQTREFGLQFGPVGQHEIGQPHGAGTGRGNPDLGARHRVTAAWRGSGRSRSPRTPRESPAGCRDRRTGCGPHRAAGSR